MTKTIDTLQCSLERLQDFSSEEFADLSNLMCQLSARCQLTTAHLQAVIDDPNAHLYVVRQGVRIIACATLCVFCSPTGRKASIEDVVVHSDFRGKHLGRWIVQHLINQAQQWAPIDLHLTSRPARIAANELYRSLGFRQKETNCYTLSLV
ncbi:MAG: GNAT family N-acetyltransferase [Bacteroidales bacterium]|nr:GNAT family N-acetyltransferase [Candidatus Physcousia equi]